MAVGAVLGWFAVILQFWLMMNNRVTTVPETITRFLSFFTILTNIMVAVYFTLMLKRPAQESWLRRASAATALTVYIFVVGAVYNFVLRQLWEPKGLQKLVDELLHSVIPLYFLVYWIWFVQKGSLKWKHVFGWLAYPLVYCVFILIRGGASDYYPYPFMDVTKLGMNTVLKNCGVLFIVFLFLSLLFVGIARALTARRVKHQRAVLD
jgi:hypothetical protein